MALAKATTNKKRRTDNVFIPAPMAPSQQIARIVYDLYTPFLLPGCTKYNPYFPVSGKMFSKSTLYVKPIGTLWADLARNQHRYVIYDN